MLLSLWIRLGVGALAALHTGLAGAQSVGGLTVVDTSTVVTCLDTKLNDGKPLIYPPELAERKLGALIRVRITFASAGSAPSVDVFYNSGSEEFADLVRRHVLGYRLPCVEKEAKPIVMTQEFSFWPGDDRKVLYGNVWEEASAHSFKECIDFGKGKPDFRGAGAVLVEMTFTSPSQGPTTRVIYQRGERSVVRSVLDVAGSYRRPCLSPTEQRPVTTQQMFRFSYSGSSSYVLKDMGLKQFLGFTENLTQRKVRFDFNTMNCPFDVRVTPYQPHAMNGVDQIERYDANRREFIEWMRTLVLKIPAKAMPDVMGTPILVSVPCLVLELS